MEIDVKNVYSICQRIEKARAELLALDSEAANLTTQTKGPDGVHRFPRIQVGARNLTLAYEQFDPHSYHRETKIVRGMEMVLLGIKKYYAGMIAERRAHIDALEAELCAAIEAREAQAWQRFKSNEPQHI